jgi:FkbM family methyltransferase
MLQGLAKPEYVFRPRQLIRRLIGWWAGGVPAVANVQLPWGLPIAVVPAEAIGAGIWRLGVHELVVSELLWRLVDNGERVADVGANYGYFTALMAARAGADGVVAAFEPHPQMLARLSDNVQRWRGRPGVGHIEIFPFALSDVDGEAALCQPDHFEANTGTAFLAGSQGTLDPRRRLSIETRRLDSVLARESCPAVLKIDVEGHEARVLAGAGELIRQRRIRDVVFEEHANPPRCATFLEQHGYSICRLRRTFLRPLLERPDSPGATTSWEAPNYLATSAPDRARSRLRTIGWQCLSRTGLA